MYKMEKQVTQNIEFDFNPHILPVPSHLNWSVQKAWEYFSWELALGRSYTVLFQILSVS